MACACAVDTVWVDAYSRINVCLSSPGSSLSSTYRTYVSVAHSSAFVWRVVARIDALRVGSVNVCVSLRIYGMSSSTLGRRRNPVYVHTLGLVAHTHIRFSVML